MDALCAHLGHLSVADGTCDDCQSQSPLTEVPACREGCCTKWSCQACWFQCSQCQTLLSLEEATQAVWINMEHEAPLCAACVQHWIPRVSACDRKALQHVANRFGLYPHCIRGDVDFHWSAQGLLVWYGG